MEENKLPSFVLTIIAIILGSRLYKQFDVESFSFEKPAMAFVYIVVFVIAVVLLVRNWKKSKTRSTDT